jgi:hypothetical protein
MTIETLRPFLLWWSIINYGVLILWSVLTLTARGPMYRLWNHWFKLSPDQFDLANFICMVLYKCGIILFNLVPCIVLYFLV